MAGSKVEAVTKALAYLNQASRTKKTFIVTESWPGNEEARRGAYLIPHQGQLCVLDVRDKYIGRHDNLISFAVIEFGRRIGEGFLFSAVGTQTFQELEQAIFGGSQPLPIDPETITRGGWISEEGTPYSFEDDEIIEVNCSAIHLRRRGRMTLMVAIGLVKQPEWELYVSTFDAGRQLLLWGTATRLHRRASLG